MAENKSESLNDKKQSHNVMEVLQAYRDSFIDIPDNQVGVTSERPMTLNAWTQTSGEDFNYLHFVQIEELKRRERVMLNKIRLLENSLQTHSKLLSRLSAISRNSSIKLEETSDLINMKNVTSGNNYSNNNKNDAIRAHLNLPEMESNVLSISDDSLSLRGNGVKYRIMDSNEGSDLIEIRLSEDLNNSDDSDRLEICLTHDDIGVKNEYENNSSHTNNNTGMSSSLRIVRQEINLKSSPSIYSHEKQKMLRKRKHTKKTKAEFKTIVNCNDQKILSQINTSTKDITNTIQSNYIQKNDNNPCCPDEIVWVSIGPNDTRIPCDVYENMNWTSPSIATRKLLMTIFDRKTLATHSMTGKPSPAFKDQCKPLKQMLDQNVIQDIIFAVTHKCNVNEKVVRNAITTKCADENKMMKLQMKRQVAKIKIANKENIYVPAKD